ncbi:MAG: gamma-D-glutamyl-L-lysine dipeptidyl-peptidase [Frankiaceae bacterium]|nr:gamma-D-glutamyl-L-lysine dipeptidyl-peptidase [Frankiaceae bacterium]
MVDRRTAVALVAALAATVAVDGVALSRVDHGQLGPAALAAPASDATAHGPAHNVAPSWTAGHSARPDQALLPRPGRTAWTTASVATVWIRPERARRVDRPALAAHPDINRWLSNQTIAQRVDLDRRVMTQSVQGEQVTVVRQRGAWSKVRLPQQRGSYYRRGIVGWVPTHQLSAVAQHRSAPFQRTRRPTGTSVVGIARHYLGVRYLWGGMTNRGIDCSGLTYRVYRGVGVTLPRDAADQARHGHAVRRRQLRVGDLVFFGSAGWRSIHHVGVYAGNGMVLHAPHTGTRVRLTPLTAWPDYWGARRYV